MLFKKDNSVVKLPSQELKVFSNDPLIFFWLKYSFSCVKRAKTSPVPYGSSVTDSVYRGTATAVCNRPVRHNHALLM